MLLEDRGEEDLHRVAEDDRVGDLHHRGLHVQREEHALRCGVVDLLREERDERLLAHEGGVDDLTGEQRESVLQHGRRPVAATCSMRTVVAAATVTDFSLCRKSPSLMVETWVLESLDHAPMRCGFWRAYSLTAFGARRSELPSRSTGFTALPLTLS